MRRHSFYPAAFAVFPILSLYGINFSKLLPQSLGIPLAIALATWALLWVVTRLLYKDPARAAFVTGLFFLSSFLIGHLMSAIQSDDIGKYLVDLSRPFLIALYALALVWTLWKCRRLTVSPEVVRALNITGITLVVLPFVQLAWQYPQRYRVNVSSSIPAAVASNAAVVLPDVYHIILDGYARQDVLAYYFNLNNQPFIDFLRQRGFYVVPESRSNYPGTVYSFASFMNMRYIDDIYGKPNQEALGQEMVRVNDVMKTFKAHGYKIVNFASGWTATSTSMSADYFFNAYSLAEFNTVLVRTSILSLFSYEWFRGNRRESLFYTFRKLQEAVEIPGPKFVFAHIVCPHGPYVFDRQGRMPPRSVADKRAEGDWPRERYADQLYFLTLRIEEVIDGIQKNSKRPYLIILNSDHGPASNGIGDAAHATPQMIHERMSNLNAYYDGPGRLRPRLYGTITPVNTFRVFFDSYLGTHLGVLPDRSYYFGADRGFVDVSNFPGVRELEQRALEAEKKMAVVQSPATRSGS